MRFKAFLTLLSFVMICCQPEIKTSDSLLAHLPPNAHLIIKVNNLSNFQSEVKNSSFLEKTNTLGLRKDLEKTLQGLKNVSTDAPCLLAFYEVGKNNQEFVMVLKRNNSKFQTDSLENRTVETLSYQNGTITKHTLENCEVFSTNTDESILLSSSKMLMENTIRTKNSNPVNKVLQRLYDTSSSNKSAAFFFNLDEPTSLLSGQLKETANKLPNFADWISVDFSANSDHSSFNGVAIASDSTKNFINLFQGTIPLANKVALFAPKNAEAIVSFTFDDFEVFSQNQNTYLDRTIQGDTLFNTVEELGLVYLKNGKLAILGSYGTESILEYLDSEKSGSTSYQGSEITTLKNPDLLAKGFNPLLKNFKSNFYTILENTFVFSEQKEPLQTAIANYKSRSSFSETPAFQTAMEGLANESSILFVSTATGIERFSEEEFVPSFVKELKSTKLEDHTFAAQMVADKGFAHSNFSIAKIGRTASSNSVTPLFTLELDTDLAMDPQFAKNHRTNKQEIVVQDRNNVLHLISSNGKVLWKKQLEGRIRGRIQQVDIYKNGRLQLAFCTNNQFLILDRNGEEVAPFAMTFEGGNLNPLAVFDYEGNKNYRFVVTQGEKVYMYNGQGKIVNGFTYTRAQSPIIAEPKHFRVANRDYLVFQLEDNSLKILHRAGGERIKVSQKIDFSGNEVFLYKNKFSVTNKKGVLHQVDTKGKLTSTNFNLNKDHGMYATSKTLVFMDDNVLSIRGKKVELDLGVYTPPKIFYIYDKIYVSVTDIQNQKIYLFDSQAKSIPNFPIFGNSLIDLVDMDNDRHLELVAKDQENSIIVYKMN
ncbi:ribonuclease HII [Flagellimonas flava]|uniref:Uncharacterized protein n=1 Tax=Flagellimonas flava TaxID=570519 RepID=A0A1M5JSZ7_9FLAO|nr:ribonuclease HII [Allomuricauda flava]SHG43410.1 hypothetical protein SAMN04488116_1191 [Allomuricauda flava]